MNPIPADALGRATMCALVASSAMQPEQMFQLSVKGDCALRGCTVIVNGKGEAKVFVGCPELSDDVILRHEGKIEARCQFCGRVYRMGPEEVEEMMAAAKGDPSKPNDLRK